MYVAIGKNKTEIECYQEEQRIQKFRIDPAHFFKSEVKSVSVTKGGLLT